VYGEGDDTLPQVVGRLLADRGETLAVAESCTGGYISNQLTTIPGASTWFDRGGVTYSNAAKVQWLGVPPYIIDRNGAVSRECAETMALGIQKVAGTTYGLSVTGIAGPTGGTPEKPVGTVFVGLAHPGGVSVTPHFYPHGREMFKVGVGAAALNILRLHLISPSRILYPTQPPLIKGRRGCL
jgi:nicotinamide-nucleotide amidase